MTHLDTEAVLKNLNTSITGLSEIEAKNRLIKYGKNKLKEEKKTNVIKKFILQLINPLVIVLLSSFVLSLVLKEYTDAIIIAIVVLLNAFLSTFQEVKAEKAIKSLSKLTSPTCIVKRDNKVMEIKVEDVVVGDILILSAGCNVAADIRLIKSTHLLIDESSLTGESLPSEKNSDVILDASTTLGDQVNMAFMSTSVVKGSGEGVVVNVGMNTQIGKIATMLKESKTNITPLQKKLNEISKILAIATVFLCVLIFVISIFQKRDTLEMLITAISLAVAVIPEGLLAVVTIVLSLGVQRLSKVNAIVKKLPSVETLGCVNVICSDKTGTLTLNKMSVSKIMVNNTIYEPSYINNESLLLAKVVASCNDASLSNNQYIGEPTEVALLTYANTFNIKVDKRIDEIPFDSNRKMMSTLNKNTIYSKGAIDRILPLCDYYICNNNKIKLTNNIKDKIISLHDELTLQGLRVIAAAYKNSNILKEDNLIFVGLIALIDPPRSEIKESINTLSNANIKTVMVTGDHKNTAFSIAKQLNIAINEDEVITGECIDKMDKDEFNKNIDKYKVFARVSPENKVDIVKAFQVSNNVVAMTGDGVNDAPSLKKADIGVAMGINGTDVSKNAADMILMDDNFSTIEKAVKEGRGIFNNIKKTLLFLLSSNFGEVLVMLIAILFNLPIPLIAIHILWVNLLTDTLPSLALGQDALSNNVMKEKPRNINESIFANKGWLVVIGYGCVIGLLSFASFIYVPLQHLLVNSSKINMHHIIYLLENNKDILMKAQTFAFSTLALSQLFHSVGIKNMNKSIFSKDAFNNKLLIVSLIFGILIQMAVTMIPFLNNTFKTSQLTIVEFIVILVFSSIPLLIHEIVNIFKKDY